MISRRKFMGASVAGTLAGGIALSGCASAAEPRTIAPEFERYEGKARAPFGNEVPPSIINYTKVAPNVGLAGRLVEGGLEAVVALGFKLIIDLRQPTEDGVAEEAAAAPGLGVSYLNMAMGPGAPSEEQVAAFSALISDPENYPILTHCASSNRAGAIWALHRAAAGVDPITAIEEGRAGGMTSRESVVREMLGLPA